jgi:hypothetical protein
VYKKPLSALISINIFLLKRYLNFKSGTLAKMEKECGCYKNRIGACLRQASLRQSF